VTGGPRLPTDADEPNGVRCDWCGAPSGESQPPLGWVTSVETGDAARAGGRRVYCPACAREHVREIEAKLDSNWW
jgi:hypothetical protein